MIIIVFCQCTNQSVLKNVILNYLGKKVMKNLVGRLKTAREIECYSQRQEKQLRNSRDVKSPQTPVVSRYRNYFI